VYSFHHDVEFTHCKKKAPAPSSPTPLPPTSPGASHSTNSSPSAAQVPATTYPAACSHAVPPSLQVSCSTSSLSSSAEPILPKGRFQAPTLGRSQPGLDWRRLILMQPSGWVVWR
jgi:hypothetical protein